ncbi:MAG: hypothetical protein JNJ63_04865 [Hyphomonadaceae bacterium]|nr:hypothetical protein [Hyphomonadaceae bacterium]
MSRVEITINSYIDKPKEETDQNAVHDFRQEMARSLRRFAPTAIGHGETRFDSIDDTSTFSLSLSGGGDFALKWVEVIQALEVLENAAREIWNRLVPGFNAVVRIVAVTIDGKSALATGRWHLLSSVGSRSPQRPLVALTLLAIGLLLGWFVRAPLPQRADQNVPGVQITIGMPLLCDVSGERQQGERQTPTTSGARRQSSDRRSCDHCPPVTILRPLASQSSVQSN